MLHISNDDDFYSIVSALAGNIRQNRHDKLLCIDGLVCHLVGSLYHITLTRFNVEPEVVA
ncbi:MAG: hypothetical protein ACI8TF_002248 [Paracoccaceae bacterium]